MTSRTNPPTPENEADRLEALRRYCVLDTAPEAAFDDIARLAAHICRTPVALVSLVDAGRQWFKARVGLEAAEAPREAAFCAHAILHPDLFVVADAAADERFATNPLVTAAPHVRFYAGAPLVTSEGHALGTLCVIDRVPRRLTPQQAEALRVLARQAVAQLELRRNVVALAADIARRERAERALRDSEERFRTLTENAPVGIYRTTPDGQIVVANPALLRLLGFDTFEELAAFNIERDGIGAGYSRARLKQLVERDGEVRGLEATWTRRDGSEVCVRENARAIRDESGAVVYYEGTVEDITERLRARAERERLEEQLRQSQKMESVGALAGGVAHDFNNLLTVISGNAQLALRKLAPEDAARQRLAEIENAARRAAALTRQLLAFSRRQHLERRALDLNDTTGNLLKMLRRVIGEDIEVRLHAAPHLPPVCADPAQIEQVLMNLSVNARDAMPAGGTLTIETCEARFDDRAGPARADLPPGRYARITVSDTGVGMDAETRARIFEPFFTTEEVGRGTGPGLSIAYGIVKQHEGLLEAESEPGRGTTFKIYLPLAENAAGEEAKAATTPPPPRGDETILLAEDEESLRRLAKDVLEDLGYTVLLAEDGEQAVERFAGARVDLLLLDVVMPRLSGFEAYRRIRTMGDGAPVIFVSGYGAEAMERNYGERSALAEELGAVLIQKPYNVEDLGRKVREVLEGARGRGAKAASFDR